ncbi:MAG TPA: uracil-DNA glycosylase family protein [Candidatus Limnocylindrales bacterium]|nr:uracil-DNA glycosylase family protein [Candidatus Limnocylindrales bacterium]
MGSGHRIITLIDGTPVETLADLAPRPGGLLFVGLDPSPVSVAAGHYHQDQLGRRFWGRLIEARVLPAGTDITLADDALVAAGHGITDLIKLPSARDEADDATLTAGVRPLWQKIALWRPDAVVFIDKRVAEITAGRPLPERWGRIEGMALAARSCFLMPGPYAAREEVDEGLNLLRNLASAVRGQVEGRR